MVVESDVEASFSEENLALSSDNETKQQTEKLCQQEEAKRLKQQESKRSREQHKQQKKELPRQQAELGKQQEVEQQKKSSQTKEHIRSSFSNKLRVARACLLSIFIAGEFFFNSTHPQDQLIVEKSISKSPTAPTQSSLLTKFFLLQAEEWAKYGDLGKAIETAKLASEAEKIEAQSLISQWEPEWKNQQDALNKVRRDYNDQLWPKVYDIKLDYSSIPNKPYWRKHKELGDMVKRAKKELDAIKRAEEQRNAEAEMNKASELAAQRAKKQIKVEPEINQPSESERPSPEQFIKDYYTQTRNGDTDKTWDLLTKAFQEDKNPGGFRQYNEFFLKRQYEVIQVETIKQTQESAEVTALLVYQEGEIRIISKPRSRWHLIWDSSRNTWQIDVPPPQYNRMGG